MQKLFNGLLKFELVWIFFDRYMFSRKIQNHTNQKEHARVKNWKLIISIKLSERRRYQKKQLEE